MPAVLQKNDPDELLRLFTDAFKEKYRVECISALHQNKAMTNYHIHLIFSERKLKEEVEEKVATRNMFYNEAGRHMRTKKEILGAYGKVRSDCCIVPKGMVYEISWFQAKEILFKKKSFTDEVRGFYTGLINQLEPEEEKLTVFHRGGPYLATKKIGKNNSKEEKIRKTNALRQEWNAAVSEALSHGVPTEDLIQMKKELIVEPVTRSIRKNGKDTELFILILRKAIKLLIEKARTFRPSVLTSLEKMKEKAKQQNTKRKEKALERKILEDLYMSRHHLESYEPLQILAP